MAAAILNILFEHAPDYWDRRYISESRRLFQISVNSELYKEIANEISSRITVPIKSIEVNQNLLDLGQTLIRGQLLMKLSPNSNYYTVRRYVKIMSSQLEQALKHNLDHRRCERGSEFIFTNQIESVQKNDIVLVVQVITDSPHSSQIRCNNSSDYFIDLIVKF